MASYLLSSHSCRHTEPHCLWKEHSNHSPTSRPLQEVHRSVILKVYLLGWDFYVTSAGRCSTCLIKLQAVWGGHCTGTHRSAVALTLLALRGAFGNWFPCRKVRNEAPCSLQMLAAISLRPNSPDSGFWLLRPKISFRQVTLFCMSTSSANPSFKIWLSKPSHIFMALFTAFPANCSANKIFFKPLIFQLVSNVFCFVEQTIVKSFYPINPLIAYCTIYKEMSISSCKLEINVISFQCLENLTILFKVVSLFYNLLNVK